MDTKEKIIQTAFVIFLEKGYKGTTYAELIKAMGVSKGALYHHFRNKEELFFEVLNHYFLAYLTQIPWDELQKLDSNALENKIREYYRNFVSQIKALTDKGMSRYFILFLEAFELHPYFYEQVQQFYKRLKALIESKTDNSADASNAIDIISRFEGYLFWLAIFPDEKFDNLAY